MARDDEDVSLQMTIRIVRDALFVQQRIDIALELSETVMDHKICTKALLIETIRCQRQLEKVKNELRLILQVKGLPTR